MSRIKQLIEQAARELGLDYVEYTLRLDGRVEIICEHGVGHPSPALTRFNRGSPEAWDSLDGVHGCDGCCTLHLSLEREITTKLGG